MKKIIILALLFCNSAQASQESYCLAMSKLAGAMAEARRLGMSEEEVIYTPKYAPKQKNAKIIADREAIAKFVYIMQPTPDEARKAVYLKCITGAYN